MKRKYNINFRKNSHAQLLYIDLILQADRMVHDVFGKLQLVYICMVCITCVVNRSVHNFG